MRKIVHISDIHFGRVDYATVKPLVAAVGRVAPDLVVVSGDLTQRARTHEFAEARHFLASLPKPQIVVPGNHDVPLYNVVARFAAPLAKYKKYIGAELEPSYADDEIVAQGLNTARSLTWKNGTVDRRQIELMGRRFSGAPAGITKILVTHHPLDLPRRFGDSELVEGAAAAMQAAAKCGVDLFLAGHYHIAHTGDTATRYRIPGYAGLVIQAGTTLSSRLRDETNSFNLIAVDRDEITVDRYTWRPEEGVFASFVTERFRRTPKGWTRVATDPAPAGTEVVVPAAEIAGDVGVDAAPAPAEAGPRTTA